MADSFSFDTGELQFGNTPAEIKLTGTIERVSNTSIKVTLKASPKWRMAVDNIFFGISYATSNISFSESYSGSDTTSISSGWTDLSYVKHGVNGGSNSSANNYSFSTTILDGVTYTVPSSAIYFAVRFYARSYYHNASSQQIYNPHGGKKLSQNLPNPYTPPSGLSLSMSEKTSTSFKISASWSSGTNDGRAYVRIGSGAEKLIDNDPVVFTGLTPNTSYTVTGRLADDINPSASFSTASVSGVTNVATPKGWSSAGSSTNSIWATVDASNNGTGYNVQYSRDNSNWQSSNTFNGLASNTKYSIYSRIVSTIGGGTSSSVYGEVWTYPLIGSLNVSLQSGQEHDRINASASANVASSYDQYSFAINSNSWQSYGGNSTYWSNLNGNTEYTIWVKMRNTTSGLESASVNKKITTWHDPLTNLKVNLVNKWFWYLEINSSYTYTGTISKYEFAVGQDQDWQNKGTTNSHSRGTTDPNSSNKLSYNTDYICYARLTDNHGRVYSANATYKTMDERPLYVNGTLREVKLIKPDGTIQYVTPNLLSVVQENGTVINMNKIINNDNRVNYM